MQFKAIEEKLNGLCSQHDYFMTLLTISDSLANIKNANQSNKNTITKIVSLEENVGEIYDSYIQLKQKQQQLGNSKLEKFKKNLQQIEQKIQEYSFQLGHIFQGINKAQVQINHSPLLQAINKINNSASSMIDHQLKVIHTNIASYKNDIEEQIMSAKKLTNMINQSNQTQQNQNKIIEGDNVTLRVGKEQALQLQNRLNSILSDTLKTQLQQYDKLNHQIALYKLQFQPPQFLPFFYHNSQQIRMRIQVLLCKISKAKDKFAYRQKITILEDEYEELYYRMKALKQYATDQLLMLYQMKQNKKTVNNLEKQINDGIKLIQNQLQLASSSVNVLKLENMHSVQTSNLQVYSQL